MGIVFGVIDGALAALVIGILVVLSRIQERVARLEEQMKK